MLPLTPGGVGVVEAGLTGPLIVGLPAAAVARVAAAVLLYRAVTYLLPIPLGALAYVWWRRTHHARRRDAHSPGPVRHGQQVLTVPASPSPEA